jgi:hypothetical protein
MANPRARQTSPFSRDGSGDITLITPADRMDLGGAGQASSTDVLLDLDSTTRAMVLPRVTGARISPSLVTPLAGMLLYDPHTNEEQPLYYDGSDWFGLLTDTGVISHSGLANLDSHDHDQYVLLEGLGCCQYIYGGSNAGGTLILGSTIHATKGLIEIGTSRYDESTQRLGLAVGGTAVDYTLDVNGDIRFRGMGTGSLGVTDGVVGLDAGGGGGHFSRDVTNEIVYPTDADDSINIGALTGGGGMSENSKLSIIVPDAYADTWIIGVVRTPSATPVFEITEAGGMGMNGTPTGSEVYFNTSLRTVGAVWFQSSVGGLNLGAASLPSDLIFQITNTTKGSKPWPAMTETERDAISSPTDGNSVFNSTTDLPNIYIGSQWYSFDLTAVGGGGGGGGPADDFNRANGNLHGSTSSSGHVWTAGQSPAAQSSTDWDILSNEVRNDSADQRGVIWLASQSIDDTIEVQITTVATTSLPSSCGLALRYLDDTLEGMWMVEMKEDSNTVRLERWYNGGVTENAGSSGWTWADGDWIKVQISGSPGSVAIDVFVRTNAGSYGTAKISVTGKSQEWASTTNHGLLCHSSGAASEVRWDNYSSSVT